MLTVGQVVQGRSGMKFAIAEVDNEKGVKFWSIEYGVLLNGEYPPARLIALFGDGTLTLTKETYDVAAAQKAMNDLRFSGLRGAAAERAQQDGAAASSRQIVRTLGSRAQPNPTRDAAEQSLPVHHHVRRKAGRGRKR